MNVRKNLAALAIGCAALIGAVQSAAADPYYDRDDYYAPYYCYDAYGVRYYCGPVNYAPGYYAPGYYGPNVSIGLGYYGGWRGGWRDRDDWRWHRDRDRDGGHDRDWRRR